jgi:hypothetical protein
MKTFCRSADSVFGFHADFELAHAKQGFVRVWNDNKARNSSEMLIRRVQVEIMTKSNSTSIAYGPKVKTKPDLAKRR